MIFKPFKPLSLTHQHRPTATAPDIHNGRPAKRRRTTDDSSQTEDDGANGLPSPNLTHISIASRSPLRLVKNPAVSSQSRPEPPPDKRRYAVLWRKVTNKKHKTWDGDGTLLVSGGHAFLKDDRGKDMGRTACSIPLLPGSMLSIAGKDVEVESLLPSGGASLSEEEPEPTPKSSMLQRAVDARPRVQVRPIKAPKESIRHPEPPKARPAKSVPVLQKAKEESTRTAAFKTPMLDTSVPVPSNTKMPKPRHDPSQEGALVMKRPEDVPNGKHIVDVVVDPLLSKHFREHQRVGVSFLYECVMGLRSFDGEGAILADDMGLGKSLQTISLLWTLLKQNPIYGDPPVIRKAIIVCPKSLEDNWRKEFRKWLGKERISVMVANEKAKVRSFARGRGYDVMIIGYEMLQGAHDVLAKAPIDLVIMDEGHRLKTAKNKSAQAIKSLATGRRVVLSGTVLQNDLSELYCVVDLVNPGILGKYSSFKRDFEIPIMRGRQQDATIEEREKGEERLKEFDESTQPYLLSRKSDILAKYLPPKTEYVVFCKPTGVQESVYDAVLESRILNAALNSNDMSFKLISILKKVCNSPSLLTNDMGEGDEKSIASTLTESLSNRVLKAAVASSKLSVLDELLHTIRQTTTEKVVVVSNYTATLDILQNMVTCCGYESLRLDGSTPPKKRQDLVDLFNRTSADQHFVFFLSTKAGGQGLNLIGASRLVLFDIDWNPALDAQAMARICRDGQKRPCFIYRLLTKGALDEKIFQRQVTKQGLADSVVDSKKSGTAAFTADELRNLFTLDKRPTCQTHDLLGCDCEQDGSAVDDSAAVAEQAAENIVVEDLPTEDDILNQPAGWMTASQLRRSRSSSPEKSTKKKEKLKGLMQYGHFDAVGARARKAQGENELEPDGVTGDSAIEDEVLNKVIMDDRSMIDYVFAKTSKGYLGKPESDEERQSSTASVAAGDKS